MSSSLVLQSLEIVDPEFTKNSGRKTKKVKNVFSLMPDSQKLTKQLYQKGRKSRKVEVLTKNKKTTILEARENLRTEKRTVQDNLRKLKQIRKACQIQLDKNIKKQIIERAVTKRPVKAKPKQKQQKAEKTAFTEDDFKKFEEEYFG